MINIDITKPVILRNGRKATITGYKIGNKYPIIAQIEYEEGSECYSIYTRDGFLNESGNINEYDIINITG